MSSHSDTSAWRGTIPPAAIALVSLLLLGLLLALAPDGINVEALQPAETAETPDDWIRAISIAPSWVIAFFLGDSLFAASFGWLFVKLRRALPASPWMFLGLVAALVKAAADLGENALHMEGAIEALFTQAWDLPPTEALTTLAAVKRGGAALTGFAVALAFAGAGPSALACRLVLWAMGIAAAAGFFLSSLQLAHTTILFFFLGLVLWHAQRQLR